MNPTSEKKALPVSAGHQLKRQTDFFATCGACKTGYSCCFGTRPPLTKERQRIIRRYLREHGHSIENPFVIEEYAYPRETAEGFCVFHDPKTRRCLIHDVKPETCVAGPITFDIDANKGKITWFIKKAQICPLAGVVYRDKELLQKHVKAAKREITRLVNELEAKELAAILLKEEPETFNIAKDDIDNNVLDALRLSSQKR